MINKENLLIRNTNESDIDFLIDSIIESEKGNTQVVSYCSLFNISEQFLRSIIRKIFEERINDFDFSLNSFLIAEYKNYPVACYSGWIESNKGMPSALLKISAFKTFLPKTNIQYYENIAYVVKEIFIKRDHLTLQLENVFVKKEYRGNGLVSLLLDALVKKTTTSYPEVTKAQIQFFKENSPAFFRQSKLGFKIIDERKSNNPEIIKYMPGKTKIKMEKEIV
jgi:ribosomal protein S18 acetylase RimI-like enzyme